MEKRKIRNYLIDRNMQLRLTLKFVPVLFAAAVLTGIVVLLVVWPVLAGFVPTQLLRQTQTQILVKLGLYSLPLLGLLVGWGIFITHAIAGPIYQIEQKLAQLLQGQDVAPLKLRRGDECQKLAAQMNRLIAMLTQNKAA